MKKMMMIMVMMMTIVISTSGKVMTNKPDNKRSNVQVTVVYDNPNGSFRISAVRPNPPCKGHKGIASANATNQLVAARSQNSAKIAERR